MKTLTQRLEPYTTKKQNKDIEENKTKIIETLKKERFIDWENVTLGQDCFELFANDEDLEILAEKIMKGLK